MDARFLPAQIAIHAGDIHAFERLIARNPDLATSRSSCSHPTLMQCLVLDGKDLPATTQTSMAQALVNAGSPLDEPLVACGSVGNSVLADYLLDKGARIDGDPSILRGWTILEEAIYWGHPEIVQRALERGATVRNLHTAAGLGSVEPMERFFDAEGMPIVPDEWPINFPFGKMPPEQRSSGPQDILDNALTYAAMSGSAEAIRFLLEKGAAINSFPKGFDYRGTALHWAALRGLKPMCHFLLEHGADPALRDLSIQKTPAEWARHANEEEVAVLLERSVIGF